LKSKTFNRKGREGTQRKKIAFPGQDLIQLCFAIIFSGRSAALREGSAAVRSCSFPALGGMSKLMP
jgi:hypothetical protein